MAITSTAHNENVFLKVSPLTFKLGFHAKKPEGDVYLLLISVIPEVMLHKLKNNLYNDYVQKKISPSLNRLRHVKLAFERNQWMLKQCRSYI